jgi:hypothetical protein
LNNYRNTKKKISGRQTIFVILWRYFFFDHEQFLQKTWTFFETPRIFSRIGEYFFVILWIHFPGWWTILEKPWTSCKPW